MKKEAWFGLSIMALIVIGALRPDAARCHRSRTATWGF